MDDTALDRVTALVGRYLPNGAAPADPDTDLRQAGLDSMGIVGLLVDVETAFGVRFADEDITPATFASVRALHGVIARCRQPGPSVD